MPLRVIGQISGTLNGVEFPARDLQCYVQTKDGRTYTALSRVPEEIGASFQLLGNLGSVIGWLFAKPISDTENGYELTGKKLTYNLIKVCKTTPCLDCNLDIKNYECMIALLSSSSTQTFVQSHVI